MNINVLLDLATEIGYRLAIAGAETYRIEESICRILDSYGYRAEVFAIPNCLTVSIESENNEPMTLMRRIGYHGNDLDAVEHYSGLSRKICAEVPDPQLALEWLDETEKNCHHYSFPCIILGNFLSAFGFALFFGGTGIDAICAGMCGILVGLVNMWMDNRKANHFFRIIAASFLMAVPAYALGIFHIADNSDAIIIGTLMLLVPGLLFTNAMRDIIFGDTNSGVNRIVQVFMIAVAIALGTGIAWNLASMCWSTPISVDELNQGFFITGIGTTIACIGFSILFNIHGPGIFLCAGGAFLTWTFYAISMHFGVSEVYSYFIATVFASFYAEFMARIRKYPAISYLVVSLFPLIPGAGVYYTMNYAVRGDMVNFSQKGMHTIALTGAMAVGILLVSTGFRVFSGLGNSAKKNK